MANDYLTTTDFESEIPEASYSSSDFPALGRMITAASRLIDKKCGKQEGYFSPPSSTDPVTLYYDGSGSEVQEIDDFVSITTVSLSQQGGVSSSDYTDLAAADFITYPLNASALGQPISRLLLDVQNGAYSTWYNYPKSVKVVGVPGYSAAVPDLIKQAAVAQVVRWFMRAKHGWQDEGAAVEIGGMRFTGGMTRLDPDIAAMLEPFALEASLD